MGYYEMPIANVCYEFSEKPAEWEKIPHLCYTKEDVELALKKEVYVQPYIEVLLIYDSLQVKILSWSVRRSKCQDD